MSKHVVCAGNLGGLMDRCRRLQAKEAERTGENFCVIVIQEARLEGFWIHRLLDRLELIIAQIKSVEAGSDAILDAAATNAPTAMPTQPMGTAQSSRRLYALKACFGILTIDDSLLPMLACHQHPGKAAPSATSRMSPRRAMRGYARAW